MGKLRKEWIGKVEHRDDVGVDAFTSYLLLRSIAFSESNGV